MRKVLIILSIIIFVFASCGMEERHDMGYVRLSLNDVNARTIMPDSPEGDVVEYKLVFTNTGTTLSETYTRNANELTGLIYLSPGNYNLVVTAYAAGDLAIAIGIINNINVIAGKGEEYTIILRPISDNGTGTFTWGITFSGSLNMTAANMTIISLLDNSVTEEIDLLSKPDDSLSLDSGQYSLLFELTKGTAPDNLTIYWREVLHIYRNLESDFEYEFLEDHFNNSGCSVTFMPNDGTAMIVQSVLYNSEITKPNDPAGLTGHRFGGWFRDNLTFAIEFDFSSNITDDISLYAKWIPIAYTIKYDANGGSGSMADSVLTFAQAQKLRDNNFSRTGYTFTGWNTISGGSGDGFSDAQDISNQDILNFNNAESAITLYAQWVISQFTVTFHLANGTGAVPAPQTGNYNAVITLPGTGGFEREGFEFTGWNTITNILRSPYAAGSAYTITQDIVIYAQWKKLPEKITIGNVNDIASYLASHSSSGTADDPIPLPIDANFDNTWLAILTAINSAGKYVDLDLSGFTAMGTEFSPDPTIQIGKNYIISIALPDIATNIVNGTSSVPTFRYFSNLKSFSGLNLDMIGEHVFRQIMSLNMTSLPESITYIGSNTFSHCQNLALTSLPAGLTYLGSNAFYECSKIAITEIPVGVTSIRMCAFWYCTNLTKIVLHAGITSIEQNAFDGCSNLEEVVAYMQTPPVPGSSAFYLISASSRLIIPVGREYQYNNWSTFFYTVEATLN